MIRSKELDAQIEFLNQVLTAMDENKLSDEKMKYVDAYLVHLEKELEKKQMQQKWEEQQKQEQGPSDVVQQVQKGTS